jgi:hypothetical protein
VDTVVSKPTSWMSISADWIQTKTRWPWDESVSVFIVDLTGGESKTGWVA